MKKYTLLTFLCLLGLASCFEDKGNYDYADINKVDISGIGAEGTYSSIAFVDTLILDPEVTFSSDQDAGNYEYEWKLVPSGLDFKDVEEGEDFIVSREKKLVMPVEQQAGLYDGYFKVKDKTTGISWTEKFGLRVKALTSEGWLVLCEEKGESRLDIVFNANAEEDIVARNIWMDKKFMTGKPHKLLYSYHLYGTHTMLVCDKGTYELDVNDLHVGEDNNLRWRFGMQPASIHLQASGISQFSTTQHWVVVDEKGDAYMFKPQVWGSLFEYPINRLGGEEEFVAAPFAGVCYSQSSTGCTSVVMYDQTNRQFVELRNDSEYPSVMQFDYSAFPVKTGYEFVYGESLKDGSIWTILKDPATGRFFFYQILTFGGEANYGMNFGEIKGPGLKDATHFAFHHLFPYLFYVSGDKVYRFGTSGMGDPAEEVLSLPGEEIRLIKFTPFVAWEAYEDWERKRNYDLLVGSVDPSRSEEGCGIMRMYHVPNMEPLQKAKEIRNLGNIVDITYKERAIKYE